MVLTDVSEIPSGNYIDRMMNRVKKKWRTSITRGSRVLEAHLEI